MADEFGFAVKRADEDAAETGSSEAEPPIICGKAQCGKPHACHGRHPDARLSSSPTDPINGPACPVDNSVNGSMLSH
jgi:hypothetical protein